MIKVNITQDQLKRAQDFYEYMDEVLNEDSFANGRGNIYGAIGEIVVMDYFRELGHKITHVLTEPDLFTTDLIIDGARVDVKTKHIATPPPKDYYRVSVAEKCHNRQKGEIDYYYFCTVMKNYRQYPQAWITGRIRKEDWDKHPEVYFAKKGDFDTDGFPIVENSYNMMIKYLEQVNREGVEETTEEEVYKKLTNIIKKL